MRVGPHDIAGLSLEPSGISLVLLAYHHEWMRGHHALVNIAFSFLQLPQVASDMHRASSADLRV